MTTLFLDSHLRCPRDHKRLVLEVGQDEVNSMSATHTCFECGYTESDRQWTRPLKQLIGRTQSERLRQLRLEGTVMPYVIDTSPWPEEEWDD